MQHTIKNTTNYLHSSYVAKTCGTEVMIEGLRQALRKDPTMPYAAYPPEFFEPKVQTLKVIYSLEKATISFAIETDIKFSRATNLWSRTIRE